MHLRFLKAVAFSVCMLSVASLSAQGIRFGKGADWQAIRDEARREGKYIFVDAYTSNCAPCRLMDRTVFPRKDVGDYFNKHFINIKLQLNTTATDAPHVRARYPLAAAFLREYAIGVFPTYLFFNADGELVHRETGSAKPEEFLERGRAALDTGRQYLLQVRRFNAGRRDAPFLHRLALLARRAHDDSALRVYSTAYLATQPDLLTAENAEFLYTVTRTPHDTGFVLMRTRPEAFGMVAPAAHLHELLLGMVVRDAFSENGIRPEMSEADWERWTAQTRAAYPEFAGRAVFRVKQLFYAYHSNDKAAYDAALAYGASADADPRELNALAWGILREGDSVRLRDALRWSARTLEGEGAMRPEYLDTYAHLLYRLGRRKEALEWELKARARALATGGSKDWGLEVIRKMQKGAPL
ncbi:thioredoxin family protein [Flaviaesturariibacter amylovorans]|uniref:Thioredoxin domain-containing protein n=1 Tax=Flaviaesturariibacter amylovorans TaxID=1084520 RepID=A0ABP8GLW9_9BACT